jgi:mono/diheme cytochrome c family protein
MSNRYRRFCGFFLAAAMMALAAQVPAKPAKGDATAGKQLFERKCSVCHVTASNQRTIGPGLKGTGKGKLPSGKLAVHDVILKLINEGGDHTAAGGGGMPVFQDLLKDQEKEDLIAYLLTL